MIMIMMKPISVPTPYKWRSSIMEENQAIFLLQVLLLLLLFQQVDSWSHQPIVHHHAGGIHIEKEALLNFKRGIIVDPEDVLANWVNSTDVCDFSGVSCNKWRLHVVQLRLSRMQIKGRLSPSLANLTGLLEIDLSENQLFGNIPPEFSSLWHLNGLDLSHNLLDGPIPDSLAGLSSLIYFNLGGNNLRGRIPASIFRNCTYLRLVDLFSNGLSGEIPSEMGNELRYLSYLNLYSNSFTGSIPSSFSNLTLLVLLDVENNLLSGELPSKLFGNLIYLEILHLSDNHFTSHDDNTNLSPFFASLSNCTNLREIEMGRNRLGGLLPQEIGNLTGLLTNINLEDNMVYGPVPSVIANLINLTLLNLSNNLLGGRIPDELALLPRLERLIMSSNSLSGEIPPAIGGIVSLGLLDLSSNNLSGEIPTSLGSLSQLRELLLQRNQLSGAVPSTLGKCRNINKLDLSYNRLGGGIPIEIAGIAKIFLNLSNNRLQGPLPSDLSKMQDVQEIDLSSNSLTGNITSQLSLCVALRLINLSCNSLQGYLPESLGDLRSLQCLDVSNNSLTGHIPLSLSKCTSLTLLNLSYNDFDGYIPSGGIFSSFNNLSFLGNPHLCGSISHPSCSIRGKSLHSQRFLIMVCVVASMLSVATTVGCITCIRKMKRMRSCKQDDRPHGDATLVLKSSHPRISHKELEEATGGFEQGRLIGVGSYGRVYRGVMRDGTTVAVKVLQLQTGNSTRSFNRECQVLKRIRHRNLMRIITTCSLPDFKALVLPFMANGSLESHLYMGRSDLSLAQRVSICSDVAEGMAYLHHHSPVKVIHCDLKPSNVLLNDDFTALVSDFGISRLTMSVDGRSGILGSDSAGVSTANILHGSIGYIAPEYGYGSSTSTKGDVYSFGVLVLEMMTRRRPTDEMFEGGLSLQRWVRTHYHRMPEAVVDPYLTSAARNQASEVKKMWEVVIVELLELGLLCSQETPSPRPTMLDAADDLDRLKRCLAGDSSATFASSLGISSSNIGGD